MSSDECISQLFLISNEHILPTNNRILPTMSHFLSPTNLLFPIANPKPIVDPFFNVYYKFISITNPLWIPLIKNLSFLPLSFLHPPYLIFIHTLFFLIHLPPPYFLHSFYHFIMISCFIYLFIILICIEDFWSFLFDRC